MAEQQQQISDLPQSQKNSSPQPSNRGKLHEAGVSGQITNSHTAQKQNLSVNLDIKLSKNQMIVKSQNDSDSDDLKDDIEDVNASYSDYSVASARVNNQSTLNSSRSGGTNSSQGSSGKNSGNGQRRKRKANNNGNRAVKQEMSSSRSMFKQLFNRFANIINKNKTPQSLQAASTQQNPKSDQDSYPGEYNIGQFENFDDQMKKIKEMYTPQGTTNAKTVKERKAIFKIDEDDDDELNSQQNEEKKGGSTATGGSERYNIDNPYNVTIEEEYISSSDDDQAAAKSKDQVGKLTKDQLLQEGKTEVEQLQQDDEYDEEEDFEDDELSDEEALEDITHCVHRLPLKNQRANLLNYHNLIEVEKEPVGKVQPKKGIFSNWFNKKEANKNEFTRFITIYENRLVVLKGTPDQVRKYGSHFNTQELEKIQMPKIWWNAQIRSSRELRDLVRIKLLNYKAVFEGQSNNPTQTQATTQNTLKQSQTPKSQQPQTPQSAGQIKTIDQATQLGLIKMQLEWSQQLPFRNLIFLDNTDSQSPHAKLFNLPAKSKTYLIDKESLAQFIPTLQSGLRKIKHFDIQVIIS